FSTEAFNIVCALLRIEILWVIYHKRNTSGMDQPEVRGRACQFASYCVTKDEKHRQIPYLEYLCELAQFLLSLWPIVYDHIIEVGQRFPAQDKGCIRGEPCLIAWCGAMEERNGL